MRVDVSALIRPRALLQPGAAPAPLPCTAETSAARIDVPGFLNALCAEVPTLADAYIDLRRTAFADVGRGRAKGEDTGSVEGEGENAQDWARVPFREDGGALEVGKPGDDWARLEMFELY